ncbi:MAG: hypothetical protein ACUVUC_00460 [Thermoguttaceae bacterium]
MLGKVARTLGLVGALATTAIALAAPRGQATAGVRSSLAGVTVLVPNQPFRPQIALLERGDWETLSPERLPYTTSLAPVLVCARLVAAIDGQTEAVGLYTRQAGRLTPRGSVSLGPGHPVAQYRLIRDAKGSRLGVEIRSPDGETVQTLFLSDDGILEFRPGRAKDLAVEDAGWKYAIVPSLVGTDFVYTAAAAPSLDRLYLPSMNLIVGLLEGRDCMMVGVWPPGQQVVSVRLAGTGPQRRIDALQLQTGGYSFYLALIEHPQLWHAEPLKAAYLEQDTPIGWKRPLEAKWIGRFFIASEQIHYPFYFRHERVKLWGRCIRGWFYWPVWFEGDKTVIHFEKLFPPQGEMLIYFLEKLPANQADPGIASPIEIIQKALGQQEAARLLDFDGVEQRPLLKHGNAVCAMTAAMQKWFDAGRQTAHKAEIERTCDDVAEFIRMIRDRIHEFGAFAATMREFLKTQAKANPHLAPAAEELQRTLDQMDSARAEDMPPESLQQVRQWTSQMKELAAQVGPENAKRFDKLAGRCRSVAGTQDDLARALSILGIRLTEQAARISVYSPAHARLAEQVIGQTRQVLRKPTWWEPRRQYLPKPDPGRP